MSKLVLLAFSHPVSYLKQGQRRPSLLLAPIRMRVEQGIRTDVSRSYCVIDLAKAGVSILESSQVFWPQSKPLLLP